MYLRDCGPTEVGGFGITQTDDPLLVTDLQLVKQTCTVASVGFNDRAVAEFFDEQVDRGLRPVQFARLWVHTHPGNSAQPSSVDEETFDRVFGLTDWAAMVILARGGQTFCRLQFHVGPGGAIVIPVRVDYSQPFDGSDQAAWKSEFEANVEDVTSALRPSERSALVDLDENNLQRSQDDWSARFRMPVSTTIDCPARRIGMTVVPNSAISAINERKVPLVNDLVLKSGHVPGGSHAFDRKSYHI